MRKKINAGETKAFKNIIEGETGEVELYRSYGTTKKVNPFIIFVNVMLTKIIFVMLMILEFSIITIGAVVLFLHGGILISTLITVILLWVFFNINTKIPRRRIGFQRKLKRLCKKNKFRLEYKREFFKSLFWSDKKEVDFILKAGKYTYFVKYATPKKPLSSMTFLSKDEIRYTKHARKNTFSLILGFKDKSKILKINFPDYIKSNDKYHEKIIIVNPNPRDILVKNDQGAVVPTGSGERIYGYTIYTGKGFLDAVYRKANEPNEDQKY